MSLTQLLLILAACFGLHLAEEAIYYATCENKRLERGSLMVVDFCTIYECNIWRVETCRKQVLLFKSRTRIDKNAFNCIATVNRHAEESENSACRKLQIEARNDWFEIFIKVTCEHLRNNAVRKSSCNLEFKKVIPPPYSIIVKKGQIEKEVKVYVLTKRNKDVFTHVKCRGVGTSTDCSENLNCTRHNSGYYRRVADVWTGSINGHIFLCTAMLCLGEKYLFSANVHLLAHGESTQTHSEVFDAFDYLPMPNQLGIAIHQFTTTEQANATLYLHLQPYVYHYKVVVELSSIHNNEYGNFVELELPSKCYKEWTHTAQQAVLSGTPGTIYKMKTHFVSHSGIPSPIRQNQILLVYPPAHVENLKVTIEESFQNREAVVSWTLMNNSQADWFIVQFCEKEHCVPERVDMVTNNQSEEVIEYKINTTKPLEVGRLYTIAVTSYFNSLSSKNIKKQFFVEAELPKNLTAHLYYSTNGYILYYFWKSLLNSVTFNVSICLIEDTVSKMDCTPSKFVKQKRRKNTAFYFLFGTEKYNDNVTLGNYSLIVTSKEKSSIKRSIVYFTIGLNECQLHEDEKKLFKVYQKDSEKLFLIKNEAKYEINCGWKVPAGINSSHPYYQCINGTWAHRAYCKSASHYYLALSLTTSVITFGAASACLIIMVYIGRCARTTLPRVESKNNKNKFRKRNKVGHWTRQRKRQDSLHSID